MRQAEVDPMRTATYLKMVWNDFSVLERFKDPEFLQRAAHILHPVFCICFLLETYHLFVYF